MDKIQVSLVVDEKIWLKFVELTELKGVSIEEGVQQAIMLISIAYELETQPEGAVLMLVEPSGSATSIVF